MTDTINLEIPPLLFTSFLSFSKKQENGSELEWVNEASLAKLNFLLCVRAQFLVLLQRAVSCGNVNFNENCVPLQPNRESSKGHPPCVILSVSFDLIKLNLSCLLNSRVLSCKVACSLHFPQLFLRFMVSYIFSTPWGKNSSTYLKLFLQF